MNTVEWHMHVVVYAGAAGSVGDLDQTERQSPAAQVQNRSHILCGTQPPGTGPLSTLSPKRKSFHDLLPLASSEKPYEKKHKLTRKGKSSRRWTESRTAKDKHLRGAALPHPGTLEEEETSPKVRPGPATSRAARQMSAHAQARFTFHPPLPHWLTAPRAFTQRLPLWAQ